MTGAPYAVPNQNDGGRTIYVGSLPPNVTERPLKDHFIDYGDVAEVKVVTGAAAALNKLGGHVIMGYKAKVSTAERKGEQEGGGGGGKAKKRKGYVFTTVVAKIRN